jgi:hypothetical protein
MAVPVDFSTISGSGNTTFMNNPQFQIMTQDTRWRLLYPAPYFDPIAMQTLMDPKIMMHWGRYFYDWHPIIHAAINKMVAYPITDIIIDTTDADAERKYKDIFQRINIRSLLIRIGLDYYVSGNAYFSLIMPFTRVFECPECHTGHSAKSVDFKVGTEYLTMVCPKCGKTVHPIIKDTPTKNALDIKPILWDPLNIKLEYDEILGNTTYYYSIPGSIGTDLDKGDKHLWATYPMYLIETARKKKLFKFFPTKILHLRRDTHSSAYNKGYGQPLISPVLKYLFHLLVLIRAQDALAIDQILPWTIISPSSNGSVDPSGELDLGRFSSALEDEYKEWKRNPMRKSIMPIPVNAQIVGAQGKALMLTNEIQEITNQILAGMGVPNEFVYGGLQWSGASVSLRMLENQLINFRTMMQSVLDYIVQECRVAFELPEVKVRMQSFKMADDVAQKDLLLRMAEAGHISKHTLLKELMPNIDYDQEQRFITEETQKDRERAIQEQIQAQNAANFYGIPAIPGTMQPMGDGSDGQQHGDLPTQNPPRAEGGNAQI